MRLLSTSHSSGITTLDVEVQSLRELVKQLTGRIEQLQHEACRQAALFRRKDTDRKPPEWADKRQHLEDRADELLLHTTPPGPGAIKWTF